MFLLLEQEVKRQIYINRLYETALYNDDFEFNKINRCNETPKMRTL